MDSLSSDASSAVIPARPSETAPVTICVTGVHGLDRPGSGGAISRALLRADAPWQVTAVGSEGLLNEAFSLVPPDRIHRMDFAPGQPLEFLRLVSEVTRGLPVTALICGRDVDLLAAVDVAQELARRDIKCVLPSPRAAALVNRIGQLDRFEAAGFDMPLSIPARSPEEAGRLADRVGYPVAIRSVFGSQVMAYSRGIAEAAARKLLAPGVEGVLLQAPVVGDGFSISGVADADGRVVARAIVRATSRDAAGDMHSGTVVDDATLLAWCKRLIRIENWRGGFTIEAIRPATGRDIQICEFSGVLAPWVAAAASGGCNLAEHLVNLTLDLPLQGASAPRPGMGFLRTVDEAAVPLATLNRVMRSGGSAKPGAPRAKMAPTGASGIASLKTAKPVNVAVTGINSFNMINPGLGVARALKGQTGIGRVVGLGYGSLEAGAFDPRLFHAAHRLPPASDADVDDFFASVERVHEHDPFDVLIPCLDGDVPMFIDIEERLSSLGIKMLLPSSVAFDRREKSALFAADMRRDWGGFRIPESSIAADRRQAIASARRVGFPAAVKGEISLCEQCSSPSDAGDAWDRLSWLGNKKVIVQPFIEGEIFATAAVCDRNSEVIATTTVKKTASCSKGSTWGAIRVRMPELEDAFAAFLKHIGWVGPVEGEFIRARFDDTMHLFEVNPRFTGWISYTAALGENHPLQVVAACIGHEVHSSPPSEPLAFIRSASDVQATPAALAAYATRGTIRHA
jgi:carbamoyl-phosphate synthase large subunit